MIRFLPLFFVSAICFASVENSAIVKSLDGKVAHCNADRKVGSQAYRPSSFALIAQGNTVFLSLDIDALTCAKASNTFFWTPRSFNSSLNKVSLDGTPFVLTFSDLEFRLINSDYQNLGVAPVTGERSKTFNFNVDINQLTTQEEISNMAIGEVKKVQWTFFLHGLKSITMNGKTELLGQFTGGSYFITFDLVKDSAGFSIQNISVI